MIMNRLAPHSRLTDALLREALPALDRLLSAAGLALLGDLPGASCRLNLALKGRAGRAAEDLARVLGRWQGLATFPPPAGEPRRLEVLKGLCLLRLFAGTLGAEGEAGRLRAALEEVLRLVTQTGE
jgi:hypothetical protein